MLVKGVVEKIWENKQPFGTFYALVINGERYGVGRNPPAVKSGQLVSFEAERNPKGYLEISKGSHVKVEEAEASAPVKAEALQSKPGYLPDREKQTIISRQSARNSAVAFLSACVAADALPIPKTAKNRFEAMMALCDQLSEDYYNWNNGKAADKPSPAADPTADDVSKDDKVGW